MAKRFTDSDKWKKPWFRRLTPAHKCFWHYVLDNCTNAGIWEVDFDLASIHIGEELNAIETMAVFGKQYLPFALGKRWFIVDFIDFQYGDLRESSNAHVSVINTLKKLGLYEIYLAQKKAEQDQLHVNPPVSGDPRGVQDKTKDKDKEQDPDPVVQRKKASRATDVPPESIGATRETLLKHEFDLARRQYPGTRGGLTVEWENFKKKNAGHLEDIIPLLGPAIAAEKKHKDALNKTRADPLQWKHFQTWINKRCWEQELEVIDGTHKPNNPKRESFAQANARKAGEIYAAAGAGFGHTSPDSGVLPLDGEGDPGGAGHGWTGGHGVERLGTGEG